MRFLVLAALLFFSGNAAAVEFLLTNNLVSLSIQSTLSSQPVLLSGYSLGLSAQKALSRDVVVGVAFEPLLNFSAREISRYSYGGYLQYVLWGQTHKYTTAQSDFTMVTYGDQAVYGILRLINNNYQTIIPNSNVVLQGSNLEVQVGAGCQREVFESSAFGLEFSVIALSFITSAEKIQSTGFQATAYFLFGN